MSSNRVKTEAEKTVSRNKRIVTHFKSEHRMAHTNRPGALGDVYKRLAEHWGMSIRELRAIIETAEAERLGIDPQKYMDKMAQERRKKGEDYLKQKAADEAAEAWLSEYYARKHAEIQQS